jgi:TonB-linked SusC/RagA family outer membrane protein
VTGSVTYGPGASPIPAAQIIIVGTQRGTQTDNDGNFRITLPAASTQLTVRAIGYLPKTVTVDASATKVAVSLAEDPAKLEQVVVTGQATTVTKAEAPTATTVIGNDQVARVPVATVDMALQGKVPGAIIETNSGAPGGGVQVQIRGVNTAVGASDPLFVVDGIIYSNATISSGLYTVTKSGSNAGGGQAQDDAVNRIADLNPADIETIEVLKSAAASSIYGSKAANGVVVITTKKGVAGKPEFDITQRIGAAHLLRGPATRPFTFDQAASQFTSSGGPAAILPFATCPSGCGYVGNASSGDTTLPNYNHLNEVAGRTPLNYETIMDVNGGTATTRYYASADVTSNGGIMVNSGEARQAVRANIDQHVAKNLEANFTSVYTHNVEDRGFANNDNSGASVPYALAYIPGFVPIKPINGVYPQLPSSMTYLGANPAQTLAFAQNTSVTSRFTTGGRATYNALTTDNNNVQLVAAGGFDYFSTATNVTAPSYLYFETITAAPGVATLGQGISQQYNWNLNAIDTYNASWAKFGSSIGITFEDRVLNANSASTTNLVGVQTGLNQGSNTTPYQNDQHERTASFYADEQVNLLSDKLFIDVGVRGEKSSANGNYNQYFYYPKAAASYRLPQFLGAGTDIKLRAAYGQTGNQPLFGQKYTVLSTTCVSGTCGYGVSGGVGVILGNPNIKPETTREGEIGADLTTWHDRVDFEFTYFHRNTTDLILPEVPAPSSGFVEQFGQGGNFQNEGIEIGGSIIPVQTRNFSYTLQSSFGAVHNEVVSLPAVLQGSFRPFGAGFGLAYGEYLVQVGRPITQIIGQTSFNNAGGFNVTEMGQSNPLYRWSFNNIFNYKQFSLNFLLDWQNGGVVQNQTLSLYACNNLQANGAVGAANLLACQQGIANPFVQSTTFLKLREVRVSYTLAPPQAKYVFGAQGLTMSLAGRNLWVSTNYYGYDPEASNYGQQAITRGVDLGQYPPSRTFFFSITARY